MSVNDTPRVKPVQSSKRFMSIQYLRGIAALMVVLTHSSIYLEQIYGDNSLRVVFGDYWSYFGVIIFFCISGFLLTSLAMKTRWLVFILHRCVRIFPLYFMVLLLLVIAMWLSGRAIPALDWRILLLIPIGPETYRPLHVEWTLVYEVAYYFILTFFCMVAFRRHLLIFYIVWFLMLTFIFLTGRTFGHHMLPHGWAVYLTSWNIAFILGGFAWMLYDRQYLKWWSGLLGTVLILSCTIHPMATVFFAPVGVSLLIAYFIQREQQAKTPFQSNILECLGNWSYAIYLVHVPILLAVLPVFLNRGHSLLSAWFCSLGLILLGSACLGQMDLLVYRKLKKRIDVAFIRKEMT